MSDQLTVNTEIDLAELHQGIIEDDLLERYFQDLALTEVLEVRVKGAPQAHTRDGAVTLDRGRELFLAEHVRGLQVRYRFDGEEWWDTLLRSPDGVRLVRVSHDFSQME